MEDPYQFAESLDQNTKSYVIGKNREFSSKYGKIGEVNAEKIRKFLQTKIVRQALVAGQNFATLCRVGGKYSVILNGSEIYSSDLVISRISISEDGKRLALFETSGSDFGTMKLYSNGKIEQEINGNIGQVVFTQGSFYMTKSFTEAPPPDGGELNSHRVLSEGKIVFGTGLDSTKFINLHRSSGKMILTVGDWNSSSIYCGDLEKPETWKKVVDLNSTAEPVGMVDGEVCYILKEGNGILRIGEKEIIRFPTPVESCNLVSEGFLATYLVDAKLGVSLYSLSGQKIKDFPLNEAMGLLSADSDGERAVLAMHSFGLPYSIWRYGGSSFAMIEENRLLSPKIEERWVQSNGAKVHYFLVTPEREGKKQALAYGYGGYNISLGPAYSPTFSSLLSEGTAIAQANLRGGGEYGKEWHDAGIRERKQNVFDDFISVISDLKAMGYKVVAKGESNGGLLVGTVMTQRPDILDGAVIGVPVLDMLRFHRMSVGKYWTTEYGDPDNREDANFLKRYSPYHNITNAQYPKALIYSRWDDDRVHPAHAIKFHMKLSEVSGNAFLRIGMSGGHSGITPAEEKREVSEIYSFIVDCLSSSA